MILTENYWPGESWEFCGKSASEKEKCDFIDSYIRKGIGRINAFLVVKNGYILHEKYRNGCTEGTHNVLMSVTKSVLSCIAGIMLKRHGSELLGTPVADFFEKNIKMEMMFNHITLKNLLEMNSGILNLPGRNGSEPLIPRMLSSADPLEFILKLPVEISKVGRFCYNSMNSHLISCIITKVTGMNACEYAARNLDFISRGFTCKKFTSDLKYVMSDRTTGWHQDCAGNSTGGWGLALTAREMAKFGLLYLRNGVWSGREILDAEYVSLSTVEYDDSVNYGYHWWVEEVNGFKTFSARGWGGQLICCIPEKNTVVVVASGTGSNFNTATNPLNIVARYLSE